MPKERFEDALNKLEKIVSQLEEGDISLEESLKLFEEGIRLSRICNQKLEEAEKKVEILLKGEDGILRAQPFSPSAGSGQAPSINSGQATSIDSEKVPSASSDERISEEDED
jgi:exodeoxyribonuclease VII small subunit